MTQFAFINPNACVEIGRTDFLAAELAEDYADTPAAIQFRRAFRERFDDIGESTVAIDAAHDLANLAIAFTRQAAQVIARIRAVEPSLVEASGNLAELATDLLTDELSRDPLARDLAGVVTAALKAVQQ